ncbi:hypothetical protein S1361_38440 [Streptomyces cyanogenus]|uniref:Uncharacterized protein n=2 Tax=Streptomyces cyanogenus TaxID=80860 RepID=A0ABX7U5I1_STRCY|nr:hypothetical protein S1361_00060 [Streptomyces cyanogenus]QTE03279.1 hypothetical protein S1361_38440 [Streptomyces cyanogenus]
MPFVRPYVRSDGTPVRGHSRWAPGARREMTIFALFGLAVFGIGHASAANGTDSAPHRPSVTYPIRFDHHAGSTSKDVAPRPTVSYPIKFGTPEPRKPAPQPTVSYPIDFSTLGAER